MLTGKERWAHKATLKAFRRHFDAEILGLRKALLNSILSNGAVGGGWG